MIESIIRAIDRQGLLKGDLNLIQQAGLQWLMNHEIVEQVELERMRIEMNALAANDLTNPKLLQTLFEQHEKQENTVEIEEDWESPQTPEEIERFLTNFA